MLASIFQVAIDLRFCTGQSTTAGTPMARGAKAPHGTIAYICTYCVLMKAGPKFHHVSGAGGYPHWY